MFILNRSLYFKIVKVLIIVILLTNPLSSFAAQKYPVKADLQKPEIYVQTGHSQAVHALMFSPDGKYLASGGGDKSIRTWDLTTRRQMWTFMPNLHDQFNSIRSLAYSPDGKMLVSSGFAPDIKVWDLETGREKLNIPIGNAVSFASAVTFSPDGTTLAAACGQNVPNSPDHTIQLFNAKTGKRIKIIRGHTEIISSVAFSPDGKYLASGSGVSGNLGKDNTIRMWEVKSGKEVHRFAGHTTGITRVVFSPDGKYLASIAHDFNIIIWDAKKKKLLKTITQSQAKFFSAIAFSPDSRRLASTISKTVTFWDITTGKATATITDNDIYGNEVCFSPDGKQIAVNGDKGAIQIWNVAPKRKVMSLGGNTEWVQYASFAADQKKIHLIDYGKRITFSRQSGNYLGSHCIGSFYGDRFYEINEDPKKCSLDDRFGDKGFRLLDGKTDKAVISAPGNYYWSTTERNPLSFSTDGRFAIILSDSFEQAEIVDLRIRRIIPLGKIFAEQKIYGLAGEFSPDGQSVAVWHNQKIGIFTSASGKLISQMEFENRVQKAIFTNNGLNIVIARGSIEGQMLEVWDVKSGKKLRTFSGHNASAMTLALSHDEKYLLTADYGNLLTLWNFSTGEKVRTLTGHTDLIKSAIFSSDSTMILSSGFFDGTARLWDTASGKELVRFITFRDGEWIAITPEGYYNASANGDHYLNVRSGGNFYGIENYREAFFRPDLVKLALSGGSLHGYRTLADIKLPPVVNITSTPATSVNEEFKVTIRLEERGGGIGDVRLFLNGSAVMLDNSRALQIVQKKSALESYRSYNVRLAPGINNIRVVAFNADNSMQSNEATQQIEAKFSSARRPAMHALIIGIQNFKNPKLQLRYAAADAELMASTLRQTGKNLFEQVNITLLTTPADTTRDAVIKTLETYRSILPNDLFVFFVASHGTVDEGEYFLLTSNVGSTSTDKLKRDALSQRDLKERIANIPATKKLIIIDTCNAAALGDAIQVAMLTRGMSEDTAMKVLARAVGSTIISASTSVQEALEGYRGHGLLTWAIAEGLQGKADADRDGFIKTTELANYVDDEVPRIAEQQFKRAQYPTISPSGQAFPLSKVK